MTAEIAIMNKSAIALAADSAVTFNVNGEPKVYQTVNKLFSLSKYEPVALMVYGTAEFMGIDWETIVKMYRSTLADQAFDTVAEYATDFVTYLDGNRDISDEFSQAQFARMRTVSLFSSIRDEIVDAVERNLSQAKMTPAAVRRLSDDIVARHHAIMKEKNDITLVDGKPISIARVRHIRNTYKSVTEEVRNTVFESLPMYKKTIKSLLDIAVFLLTKEVSIGYSAGIVIAGYGTGQVFPALETLAIDGVFGNHFKFQRLRTSAIGRGNPAAIIPFAQSEMVVAFMEGADPEYQNKTSGEVGAMLDGYSSALLEIVFPGGVASQVLQSIADLNAELAKHFEGEMSRYRQERFVEPVVRIVAGLPKSELAAMAESLVNLTSFRRHVTPDAETVGGPIDVAVISRGDGFVWIKRKHYFEPELNPHFFRNYFRGEKSGRRASS